MSERPVVFSCAGEQLIGVAHVPDRPLRFGVVVVVGGPQYRAGSHRQFVSLARALEAGGFSCLRFDYRGMGDSAASMRTFETIGDDLRVAIDTLIQTAPAVERVVLWGLCDGASAALMYAPNDARIEGVIALNPWVRTEASLAAAHLNHYYKDRILSSRFWWRLLSGEVQLGRSVSGLATTILKRTLRGKAAGCDAGQRPNSFIDRMGHGWSRMRGQVLVVLSGKDLTAREFADFCKARPDWREAVAPGPNFAEFVDADHTFSKRDWKHGVEQLTLDWLHGRLAQSVSSLRCDAVPVANISNIQGST